MSDIVVPPAPHWYKSNILTCAPDDTLVYGSKNDVVIITPTTSAKPAEVNIIHHAHRDYIVSVSLNKKWKNPHSLCVSVGEDGLMNLWNIENLQLKSKNKILKDQKEPYVGAVFAGDDRVVGVTTGGSVVLWNIHDDEAKSLKDLFKNKVHVTSISSCPHAGWLLAFGLYSGAIIVADMRRDGQVLYKLRGHYHSVVGLTWCPAPINVFPKNPQNTVTVKTVESEAGPSDLEIKKDKSNPWVNLVHVDESEIKPERQKSLSQEKEFLQECTELKDKILQVETSEESDTEGEKEKPADKITEDSSIEQKEEESDEKPEADSINESRSLEKEQDSGNGRPLPVHFDPSSDDFLDDSIPIGEYEIVHQEIVEDEIEAESTVKTVSVEEEPRSEYLLASCARDGSVYIWRAGTDGRMQTFFNILSKKGKKDKSKKPDPKTSWVSACWVSPDTLLTSSFKGDVLAWPMPKPKDAAKQYKIIHSEHSSYVFNLATPLKLWTSLNWREERGLNVWSWGHGGKLVRFDLNNDKITHSYTPVSAPITCLQATPVDPNRLAIGMRDGNIGIWDLSNLQANIIYLEKHYSKQTHKVCAMAWHPNREMLLAFGTEEGRVGCIEMASKKTILLNAYFNSLIHKIEWGPIDGDVKDLGLYVLSESRLVIYDINNPKNNPTPVSVPKYVDVYRFAWKPDMSLMLMSAKDGSFFVLNNKYNAFNTSVLGHKGSSDILWHPDAADSSDGQKSPRSNWFAITTPDGLSVYNCVEDLDEQSRLLDRMVAKFEGHLRPPVALAWCPFYGDRIASTSTDGLTYVWDISQKTALSTFVDSYLSQNNAIIWSPHDPDLILLGDKMLRFWSIKGNPPKLDKNFVQERKHFIEMKVTCEGVKKTSRLENVGRSKSIKNVLIPAFYTSSETNFPKQVDKMRILWDSVEKNDDMWEENALDPLQVFGSERQVTQLLSAQYNKLKDEGKTGACEFVSLLSGNMDENIIRAVKEKRVTLAMISIAPMVSLRLWQDCCETYASQLSENVNSDPLEIAQYYLASHQIEEAALALCRGLRFREALSLVRRRLPGDSKLVTEVTKKWAFYSMDTGNFETAALCFISLKRYEEAGKVLSRRSSRTFLKFALELVGDRNQALRDSIQLKLDELEKKATELDEVSELNTEDKIAAYLDICIKQTDRLPYDTVKRPCNEELIDLQCDTEERPCDKESTESQCDIMEHPCDKVSTCRLQETVEHPCEKELTDVLQCETVERHVDTGAGLVPKSQICDLTPEEIGRLVNCVPVISNMTD